jgi:hypothetical protein
MVSQLSRLTNGVSCTYKLNPRLLLIEPVIAEQKCIYICENTSFVGLFLGNDCSETSVPIFPGRGTGYTNVWDAFTPGRHLGFSVDSQLPSLRTQGFRNDIQRMGRRICKIPTPVYSLGIGIWFLEKILMGILGLLTLSWSRLPQ